MLKFGNRRIGPRPKRDAPPDYADGRAFDPLTVEDGKPRILVTIDPDEVDERGNPAIHTDWWNMRGEAVGDVLILAAKHALRGAGEVTGDDRA